MRKFFLLFSLFISTLFLQGCIMKTNPQEFHPYLSKKLFFARSGLLVKSSFFCSLQEDVSPFAQYLILTPERQQVVHCEVVDTIPKGTAFHIEKVTYKDIPDVLIINIFATIDSGKFKGVKFIFPSNGCSFIPYNAMTEKNYCQEREIQRK